MVWKKRVSALLSVLVVFTLVLASVPHMTYADSTIDIKVTKEWIGSARESATVHLYKRLDDEHFTEVGSATLTADHHWTHTFEDLPKNDSEGNEIDYFVEEDSIDGYTSAVAGDETVGFTVINTQLTSVSGTVVWDDADDQDGIRPDSVTVNLLRGEEIVDTQEVTVGDGGIWSFSFNGLAKCDSEGNEYTYDVKEADDPKGYTSTVSSDASNRFTITNSHTPETTSVSVSKVWVGPPGTSATFALSANGIDTGQTLTLSAHNGWAGSFDGLAKYKAGAAITYTVSETGMGGVDSSNYPTTVSGDASSGYTFTNTDIETIDVSGTVVWDDDDDRDGKRPDSVTVSLLRDGTPAATTTVTPESGWSFLFEHLAKYDSTDGHEYTYTVEEANVPDGYTSAITGNAASGFTVTNTHEPETVSIPVTKVWVGSEGGPVTVHLFADGEDTGEELTLSDDGSWTGSFDGVYKYADGEEIDYTVTEDAVEGYSSSVTGDASSGFTITNTQDSAAENPASSGSDIRPSGSASPTVPDLGDNSAETATILSIALAALAMMAISLRGRVSSRRRM